MTQTATTERDPSHVDLRALIDLAPDAIFIAEPDGRLSFVNDAACRLLGCARAELLGMAISSLVAPEHRACLEKSSLDPTECRLRRKDGTWVPVEARARLLEDGQWQGFVRDITDRKRHETEREALLARVDADREWLQTVLDTMPLGTLLFQPGGRLLFNRRTEELLGMQLSPTGGSAQYASRIRLPDGRPVPPDRLPSARVMRGEYIVAEEYRVERPDGSCIPVLGSMAPMRDAHGRVNGAVGVFQDISERMRMDDAIRTNERLLRAIFEILPVGIWIADKTGRIASNNPAGERIWKGARYVPVPQFGEYRGWWLDTGKRIEAEEWALARALGKGETSTGELVRIQCFDGSFKTIINSAAPLQDEKGAIAGAIVVNEDITALHEAQEKQRANEQLLRAVIDLLPVGLWITDREGRITLANPAGERIWQGTRYVAPDRYAEYKAWWVETGQPIPPDDWGLSRAIRKGETSRGELIRIQCFDGSFKTVINLAAPIRSDAGEIVGAIAVNEDITSLQQTQEQLRAAVRDREELLAIVAHDLRSPLSGLMMGAAAAALKARGLPGGEAVGELAETLGDITRRMSGLVDDLLAVAVSTTGGPSMLRLEPVAASNLVARAAQAARPLLARESLELDVKVAGELPQVHADAARILRVFANLLDNALKYTSPRGRITMAAERTAGGVRFTVANSGAALTQEELGEMFRPFWQAGRDRRGAGLGLSICRAIVEAHGGSIWAEPAEGQRVRVCFVLPRQPASA
jgi:PAS domain S-box-containing protein